MNTSRRGTEAARAQFISAAPKLLAVLVIGLSTGNVTATETCIAAPIEGKANVRICDADFPTLWQRREQYDGRYIMITGFATYVDGSPYLFASKDLYTYMAARGGIALDIDPSDAVLFRKVVESGGPVTLQGRYAVNHSAVASIGLLIVPKRRFWPETMPGERPQRPPD